MDEELLPSRIKEKATISSGGECAWRMADVEEAIEAGRSSGLACIGGEVQFHVEGGVCEPAELSFSSAPRRQNESWQHYVDRAAGEMLTLFRKRCAETNFVEEAKGWSFLAKLLEENKVNVLDCLKFVLYFDGANRQAPPK